MNSGQHGQLSGKFVNPYTFLPFVKPSEWSDEHPWLAVPAGHDRMRDGRFSGLVEVEITARSPLLIRNVVNEPGKDTVKESKFPLRRVGNGGVEQPFVPGSTIAGVARSLHECIAGGCLRVFDGNFRPGYRDEAKARTGWRMARVERVDANGKPVEVTICPQTTWVPATWLADVLGGWRAVYTGATVNLRRHGREVHFGKGSRQQLADPLDLERGNDWVLLLTDSGTRRNGPNSTYFCAVGKLGGAARPVVWDNNKAWDDFLDAVEGSDDLRCTRQAGQSGQEETKPIDVTANPKRPDVFVGRRMAARRRLFCNQVVWVRLAEPYQDEAAPSAPVRICAIALAYIWRHSGGEARARNRVPPPLRPCQDVGKGLCPTCRLFGSAETEGTDTATATQKSYRGHLRFSDAVLPPGAASPSLENYLLPPLAAPHPGAGQFYLRHPDNMYEKPPVPAKTIPLREWGSILDAGTPRNLRGRKWYWLTGDPDRRPFFRVTKDRKDACHVLYEQSTGGKNAMLSSAEAVPAGTRFRFTVHFENLSLAELGGVLAALAPQHVLTVPQGGSGTIGFSVGGGRPLGFGSCTSEILGLEAYSARSRYATPSPNSLADHLSVQDVPDAVDAFRRTVPADQRKRIWKALSHALCLDRVPPDLVWYPPTGDLGEDGGRLAPEHLRSRMAFWRETRGFQHESGKEEPLKLLPILSGRDQSLEIEPGSKAVRRGNDRWRR